MTKHYTNDWFAQNAVAWPDVLKEFKNKPIKAVELGAYEGQASVWLMENILTHPDSSLDCVDTWLGSPEHSAVDMAQVEKRFRKNTQDYSRLTTHKMTTVEYLKTAPLADLIYVDAGHTTADCLTDGVLSHLILNSGGILIFDDYLWAALTKAPDVPRGAIDAFLECYSEQYEPLYLGRQAIVRKK